MIRYYNTHHKVKQAYVVPRGLGFNTCELSGAIHMLSVETIADCFGYASIRSFNQFLSNQTHLTANEIRTGRNAKKKMMLRALINVECPQELDEAAEGGEANNGEAENSATENL